MAASQPQTGSRLRRLGQGQSIAAVCRSDGIDRDAFDGWWEAEVKRRARAEDATVVAQHAGAQIHRDQRGLPRISASDEHALFFAYGAAQAEDRLFQMDLRRRRGLGRLAELLGSDALAEDRLARTVGLHVAARAELDALDADTVSLLGAFSDGVNALIEIRSNSLPIEYDLLGTRPDPWTPFDSVACAASWRWQLTGRMHVITGPEMLKRELHDDALWAAVLGALREADEVSIVADLEAETSSGMSSASIGVAEAIGSNNWAVSGSLTVSGKPMLASDPHMPYEDASAFHEVGLDGGSFDVLGAGFVGVPALAFGRNASLAWGITNNVCSLRDLYLESVNPANRAEVLFDGHWERLHAREETIAVAGGASERLTVESSRNGPIVSDVLPASAAGTGVVSLRWLGSEPCEWIAAQLRLMRATSVSAGRAAVRGWLVPTFNLLLADADGHIGYQATGELPVRRIAERAYRPGSDPEHSWDGRIPFENMPRSDDPARGWLASANNRPAPDAFPYPLSGTWEEGYRAKRIGQLITTNAPLDVASMATIQVDVTALRALRVVDGLIGSAVASDREAAAIELLRDWDGRLLSSSQAAALYEILLWRWVQAVAAERVSEPQVESLAPFLMGLAVELIERDVNGWFQSAERRLELLRATLGSALEEVRERCGSDMAGWSWGAIHRLSLPHRLGTRGDLGVLLGRPSWPVGGDSSTVSNYGFLPPGYGSGSGSSDWLASSGATYRIVADLGDPEATLHAATLEGQSAEIGSAHRDDQLRTFIDGRLFSMPLIPRRSPDA